MPVMAVTVAPQDISAAISAVGSLVAGEAADIHAEISGQIEEIQFEEGQPVKKGDVLLQIDKSLIETDLAKAQAAYDVKAVTFGRSDKLRQSGYLSTQQWDETQSGLQEAKAAIANARIRLEKSTIRAPFDGVAGLRSFSVGDYAEVGQTLTSVVSLDPLKLEFSAPEKNYSDIRQDQSITFAVDAWPGESFTATIYAVDPRVDPETRHFKIKAQVPNAGNRLRPGMYARIDIDLPVRKNALLIPEEAIIPQGNDIFVLTIRDGKAARSKITPGLRQNGLVEAATGLLPGDQVITAGVMRIREGMPVAPLVREK